MAVEQARSDVVVAVGEDRRGHRDQISQDPFGRVAPTVYLWLDLFYNDAPAPFSRFHLLAPSGFLDSSDRSPMCSDASFYEQAAS